MQTDIVLLLMNIKQNIAAVEQGECNNSILSEIESDCVHMLELMKLFLISERDSYYGYFLMNLTFEIDFSGHSIAGILLNRFPPVFHTNPLLLCKFSLKEILFIVCHEIDHIVFNHPAEMLKANPERDPDIFEQFNIAADASVNDRILKEIKDENRSFLSAPEGHISSDVLKKMLKLRSIRPLENYLYYFQLIQGKNLSEDAQQPQQMLNAVAGSGDHNDENDDSDTTEGDSSEDVGNDAKGDGDESGDNIVTADNCGKPVDHDWNAGEDSEEAAAAVRELVNATTSLMNDEVRGQMPGFFWSQVQALNKPPQLCWKAILKKYVGTIAVGKRKTRTRLNRRQPERFDLPGRQDDKILKIVAAIDTSGSVSDRDVAYILNEIIAIIAGRKHSLTVIECDSKIQRVYQVKTQADIKKNVAGRGGTAFTPVVEYINNDRYFRDALLIYFTDGYGEREIPRPKTYRNLWVILGNTKNLSVAEPYGSVVAFGEE